MQTKRQSSVYSRAESMLVCSQSNFQQQVFFKQLSNFLGQYMDVESMVVNVGQSKDGQFVLTVCAKNFKGTILPS
ncbi:MAG: hypothetical protein IJD18_03600 [Clostridia bacterium]|nr:hypothetical protein [Clostridia bacterium]MBQ3067096.1 hypothetical protein [Clostridia bacterium]